LKCKCQVLIADFPHVLREQIDMPPHQVERFRPVGLQDNGCPGDVMRCHGQSDMPEFFG
jgi:hypothetical protein